MGVDGGSAVSGAELRNVLCGFYAAVRSSGNWPKDLVLRGVVKRLCGDEGTDVPSGGFMWVSPQEGAVSWFSEDRSKTVVNTGVEELSRINGGEGPRLSVALIDHAANNGADQESAMIAAMLFDLGERGRCGLYRTVLNQAVRSIGFSSASEIWKPGSPTVLPRRGSVILNEALGRPDGDNGPLDAILCREDISENDRARLCLLLGIRLGGVMVSILEEARPAQVMVQKTLSGKRRSKAFKRETIEAYVRAFPYDVTGIDLETGRSWSRMDADRLRRLVWSRPVREISEEFGISQRSVYKKCKKLEIRIPTARQRL